MRRGRGQPAHAVYPRSVRSSPNTERRSAGRPSHRQESGASTTLSRSCRRGHFSTQRAHRTPRDVPDFLWSATQRMKASFVSMVSLVLKADLPNQYRCDDGDDDERCDSACDERFPAIDARHRVEHDFASPDLSVSRPFFRVIKCTFMRASGANSL